MTARGDHGGLVSLNSWALQLSDATKTIQLFWVMKRSCVLYAKEDGETVEVGRRQLWRERESEMLLTRFWGTNDTNNIAWRRATSLILIHRKTYAVDGMLAIAEDSE